MIEISSMIISLQLINNIFYFIFNSLQTLTYTCQYPAVLGVISSLKFKLDTSQFNTDDLRLFTFLGKADLITK